MSNRLYVGNLSWGTTDETLRQTFEEDGRTVNNVQIMTFRDTGRPRGFAFVDMGSAEDAEAAIKALDGQELDGRDLRVNLAQERQPREGGGGGGRGGRGGRGRGRGGYGGGGGGGRGGYRDDRGGGGGGSRGGYRDERGGGRGGYRDDRDDRW
ncbi:MAG: RNA-binding protein [Planctomycetes bacterium]|nr:RNA-binding protein [Planctomycetota bacterium]